MVSPTSLPIISLVAISLIIALSGCATGRQTTEDPWLAKDKALHFLAGTAVGAAGTYLIRSRGSSACAAKAGGIGLAFSVGLAKEWSDGAYDRGTVSGRDLLATLAGGLLGAQLSESCLP